MKTSQTNKNKANHNLTLRVHSSLICWKVCNNNLIPRLTNKTILIMKMSLKSILVTKKMLKKKVLHILKVITRIHNYC